MSALGKLRKMKKEELVQGILTTMEKLQAKEKEAKEFARQLKCARAQHADMRRAYNLAKVRGFQRT